MIILDTIVRIFWYYFTPLLKIFLRKCTGLCELQRICYKTEKGAQRCINVEKSLNNSKSKVISKIRDKLDELVANGEFNSNNHRKVVSLVEYAVEAICVDKSIDVKTHAE